MGEYQRLMAVYYQRDIQPKPHVARYLDQLRARGKRLCVGHRLPLQAGPPGPGPATICWTSSSS